MKPTPLTRRRFSFFPQLLLAAVFAAGLYLAFTLPPGAAALVVAAPDPRVAFGAYHIHTNRSDGTGTPDEIAAAASRAGLQFVVLTDHGVATRQLDPPEYRHGVLVIDAAEISSAGGHIVALGMERSSPYPFAGEARDVIDDIHRLGGWAVAAHPDSPRPELRWRNAGGPNGQNAIYDGIEWLNLDSEWRDETATHLLGSVARYFVRGPETIAALIQRPAQTLRRWDMSTRARPVVGLAALDAHARVPWRTSREDTRGRTIVALPTYRQMLRTVSQAAVLDRPLTGQAPADSARVLAALRAGRAYSVVTAFAAPGYLSFQARQEETPVTIGESLNAAVPRAVFSAEVNDPAARVTLLHNGSQVAAGRGRLNFDGAALPGAYRVEVYRPTGTVPWIVSNPIYGPDGGGRGGRGAPAVPDAVRFVSMPGEANWAIERSPTSSGVFIADGPATRFSFGLGPGVAFDQFAALVASIGGPLAEEGFDRVRFTVRAEGPMRFSVQLRLPGNRRWRHSVYADATPRPVELLLQDFQPADGPTAARPNVARVRNLLFVVDTLNAFPGTKGSLWLSDVVMGVGNPER